MKIAELLQQSFGTLGAAPGTEYVLNPGNNTANVAMGNAAPNTSNVTTQPVLPAAQQQLSRGNTLNAVPVGPQARQQTFKVDQVLNDKDKTVILTNPRDNTKQAYPSRVLAPFTQAGKAAANIAQPQR